MIILDTNVISEPMRAKPDPGVMQWLDDAEPEECYITVISVGELCAGAERLPSGAKRAGLEKTIEIIVGQKFAGRVLPFDLPAARSWGMLTERLRRNGLNGMQQAVMIAAIAFGADAMIATGDTRPYKAAGLRVINPWTD